MTRRHSHSGKMDSETLARLGVLGPDLVTFVRRGGGLHGLRFSLAAFF